MGLNRIDVFCNTEDQLVFTVFLGDGVGFALDPPLSCFLLEHSLTVTTTPIDDKPADYDRLIPFPEIDEWVNRNGAW